MTHHPARSLRTVAVLLCGAFVLGGLADDAFAKRKRRRRRPRTSRAVRKAEAARVKAEIEAKKAEEDRKKAEAEAAAAEAQLKAEKARIELENLKQSGSTGLAPANTAPPAAAPAAEVPNTAAVMDGPMRSTRDKGPLWGGFYMSLNIGYATSGGTNSPKIPDPKSSSVTTFGTEALYAANPLKYQQAITTDTGSGVAVCIQIGYNIMGYASLWVDVAAHGSFGAKSDLAGGGAIATMVGFHPLRLWRPDAPYDLKLYGGYGFFEILAYHETVFQTEATGKSWTGTAIPFGLSGEYRIPDSIFAIGLDLRMVRATYDKWIYNWDKDITSDLNEVGYTPTTVTRFEPRIVFGWHF